jgi:hypothetical protein
MERSITQRCVTWIRLRYTIRDSWTGEQHKIDEKVPPSVVLASVHRRSRA